MPCISISPVVRDAAARAPARRCAADEGGRVGARRDRRHDVEREAAAGVPLLLCTSRWCRRGPQEDVVPAAAAAWHGWIHGMARYKFRVSTGCHLLVLLLRSRIQSKTS